LIGKSFDLIAESKEYVTVLEILGENINILCQLSFTAGHDKKFAGLPLLVRFFCKSLRILFCM
jgi:hypothetical protein